MAWTLSRYRSLRVVGPVVGPAGSAGQAWRFPLPTPQDPQKGSEESEICVLHVPTAFYLPKKRNKHLNKVLWANVQSAHVPMDAICNICLEPGLRVVHAGSTHFSMTPILASVMG